MNNFIANNFDTIFDLDDAVTRLECGISNLACMLESVQGCEVSGSRSNALLGSLFYLSSVEESLRTIVDKLFQAKREAAQ